MKNSDSPGQDAIADAGMVLAELREREAQLRSLGDSLPDSYLYQYTVEAGKPMFLYISSGVERVNGVRPEQVLQDPMCLMGQIEPGQLAAYIEAQAVSERELSDFEMELHLCRPDGEWRWLLVKSRPRKNAEGQIVWDGIATDITGRHLFETEINRLAQAIEQNPTGILITRTDGTLDFMNEACSRISGYRFADAYGGNLTVRNILFAKMDEAGYAEVLARLHAGKTWSGTVRNRRRNGDEYWQQATVAPVFDNEGKVASHLYLVTDVSGQKDAEAMRLRLAAIVESSHDAIVGKNLDGIITSWNKAAERIYGYSEDEVLGRHVSVLAPPSRHAEIQQHLDIVRAGGTVVNRESERVRKDGAVIHVALTLSPIRDATGAITGISTIVRDVTEKKHLEEELRQAGAYNRSLIEASLDPLVTISPEGKITDVNQATEAVTGCARAELIGTDFSDYFTEPEHARAGYRKVFQENSVRDYPLSIRHKDGHITEVLYNASVYRDENGNALGVFAAARDVTERNKAEKELLQNQHHAESLLRLSRNFEMAQSYRDVLAPAGDEIRRVIGYQTIWVFLFSDDRKYAYPLEASGAMSDGILQDEVTAKLTIPGDPMLEEIAAADHIVVVADALTDPRTNKEIVSHLKNRTIVNVPIIFMDKHLGSVGTGTFGDEGVRPPSPAEEQYLLALASHMAVTLDRLHLFFERRKAEAKITELNRDLEQRVEERTAQLEAANKELEAFSYSVSHDLRTPLRAIDGFSRIVLDEYADKLDDEGKRLLNIVRNNSNRMAQLIDDILQFSRTGRLEIAFTQVDMSGLAHEVAQELQETAPNPALEIRIGELPQVNGDRTMLRQVFVNLLANAIKFSRARELPVVEVKAERIGEEIIYSVRDNGAGFDMRYQEKLFGVFQRLHTVGEFEGTGIGLAIVKRIVTRHGGRVWAEGKVGEGATIYFALPAAQTAAMDWQGGHHD